MILCEKVGGPCIFFNQGRSKKGPDREGQEVFASGKFWRFDFRRLNERGERAKDKWKKPCLDQIFTAGLLQYTVQWFNDFETDSNCSVTIFHRKKGKENFDRIN
jgi:hypothetical protein